MSLIELRIVEWEFHVDLNSTQRVTLNLDLVLHGLGFANHCVSVGFSPIDSPSALRRVFKIKSSIWKPVWVKFDLLVRCQTGTYVYFLKKKTCSNQSFSIIDFKFFFGSTLDIAFSCLLGHGQFYVTCPEMVRGGTTGTRWFHWFVLYQHD